MFIDQARVYVKGGDGGNGCVAFRREKFVPRGGPYGGDGGRGGDVIFRADDGLSTLMDFKYQQHFKAERGTHGRGKNQHGAKGEDIIVRVPVGTVLKDEVSGEILADLTRAEQEFVVARGGRGGRGNSRFTSSINRAPTMAENGEAGEKKSIKMELKLLADVGLVGLPNAGKSTLISRMSAARPKIADYPFTTLVPNLGVVMGRDHSSFVVADIPGLIEGAHAGIGLGHDFLRHIERTKVLLFVMDAGAAEGQDPIEDFLTLQKELELYNPGLLDRPYLVVANKLDLPGAENNLRRLRDQFGDFVFGISAITGQGVTELIDRTIELLKELPEASYGEEVRVIRRLEEKEPPFVIEIIDGVYEVSGKRIEHLLDMTDFDQEDSLRRFHRAISQMGLEKVLREKGIQTGQMVRIKGMEFEYSE